MRNYWYRYCPIHAIAKVLPTETYLFLLRVYRNFASVSTHCRSFALQVITKNCLTKSSPLGESFLNTHRRGSTTMPKVPGHQHLIGECQSNPGRDVPIVRKLTSDGSLFKISRLDHGDHDRTDS